MNKLYAISDLHLETPANLQALKKLPYYVNDWLIVAGDLCVLPEEFEVALDILTARFARVIWVPGNHDLWTLPSRQTRSGQLRGQDKYSHLVDICRAYRVLTPEDPYAVWGADDDRQAIIVPMFLLYDYSFRPSHIAYNQALDWAAETGIVATDEVLLHSDPYDTIRDWCHTRCDVTYQKLQSIPVDMPLILVNHYPLRYDLLTLFNIPRFSLWCGTTRTETWHQEFNVACVIYGHLHVRGNYIRDKVPFFEVSLGYPQQWFNQQGVHHYLKEIQLPS